jgi:putative transcriptional regulator
MKKTPFESKAFLYLAAFFLLLPSALKLYTGETQRLIVASGKLTETNFAETVLFIFHHNPLGAYGVVINRPVPRQDLGSIPVYLRDKNLPLYHGGPVAYPDHVYVIERHQNDESGEVTLVSRTFDVAVTEEPDLLSKIEASVKAGRDDYRIYLGYAGWGVFQLDNEFRQGVWASTKLKLEWLFYDRDGMSDRDVWINALQDASGKRKPRNPGAI